MGHHASRFLRTYLHPPIYPLPSREGKQQKNLPFIRRTNRNPSPFGGCVLAPSLSLRATGGSAAISLFSIHYEIASVVSLPRNDIATQSLAGEGNCKCVFYLFWIL